MSITDLHRLPSHTVNSDFQGLPHSLANCIPCDRIGSTKSFNFTEYLARKFFGLSASLNASYNPLAIYLVGFSAKVSNNGIDWAWVAASTRKLKSVRGASLGFATLIEFQFVKSMVLEEATIGLFQKQIVTSLLRKKHGFPGVVNAKKWKIPEWAPVNLTGNPAGSTSKISISSTGG